MTSSHRKGSRAERQVVALWRENGWPRACRSPGSGSLRPYGAQDSSPWPGDLAHVEPWIVEVKCDERAARIGRSGIEGEAFVRAALRRLAGTLERSRITGRRRYACLFLRSNRRPWRVWTSADVLAAAHRRRRVPSCEGWLQLDVETFFALARRVAGLCSGCGGPTGDMGAELCVSCWQRHHDVVLPAGPLLREVEASGMSRRRLSELYEARYGLATKSGQRSLWRLAERGTVSLADADRWACLLGLNVWELWGDELRHKIEGDLWTANR